jgi:phosphoribosylanthranilate isomerase
MLKQPLIQIAGIMDRDEAELVLACGVHYLGFPLRLPVHEEDLSEAAAAEIIRSLKPPARGVVITYLEEAGEIAEFCAELGTDIVQLHGDIRRTELEKLSTIAPELTVIKSLVIGLHDEAALSKMVREQSPFVDAFITDTFDPQTGASGATGQTHDWEISRRLVELSSRPVILAGGLNPDNVRDAILTVRPAGVDVHTGVEEVSGRKSREKLTRFMTEARAGFREIGAF